MPWQPFIARLGTSATVLTLLSACTGEPAGSAEPVAVSSSPSGAVNQTGALDARAASSCAEEYSAPAVAERAFSFDGTVAEIATSGTSDDLAYVSVKFAVNEWFRGGTTDRVTVDMAAPDATTEEVAVAGSYGRGSRLLVSGQPRWGGPPLKDAIAWGCGFTRYYDPRTADSWRQAAHTWHPNASDRGGKREVKVFFVDPVVRDGEWVQWSLQSEEVSTIDTGDPGVDAVRALFNSHPANDNLVNGFSALRSRRAPLTHVQDVAVAEGVITVDISRSVWNPYPTLACACPKGDEAMQQLVWTVQAALGSNDPISLTVNGKPARGVWLTRLDGPVAADPTVVAQPAGKPETVKVPNVVGLSEAAARRELRDAGLKMVEWGEPTGRGPGVTTQVPSAGSRVAPGSVVTVAVLDEPEQTWTLPLPCAPQQREYALWGAMRGWPTMVAAVRASPGDKKIRVLWHGERSAAVIVRSAQGPSPAGLRLVKTRGEWYVEQMEYCSPAQTEPPNASNSLDLNYRLVTHCGIHWANFDGRTWITTADFRPRSSAPENWDDPVQQGEMRLIAEDVAVFRSEGHRPLLFRATEAQPVPCD